MKERKFKNVAICKREEELIRFLSQNSDNWFEAFFIYADRRARKLRAFKTRSHRTRYRKKQERRARHLHETNMLNRGRVKKARLAAYFQRLYQDRLKRFDLADKQDATQLKESTVRTACTWFNKTLKSLHEKHLFTNVDFVKHGLSEGVRHYFWQHPSNKEAFPDAV